MTMYAGCAILCMLERNLIQSQSDFEIQVFYTYALVPAIVAKDFIYAGTQAYEIIPFYLKELR